MAYQQRKLPNGDYELVISGWENGIAPSPHKGIGDLKNINISSIQGEASIAYNRVRLDTPAYTAQSGTIAIGTNNNYNLGVAVPIGTWILVSSVSGSGVGITNSNYYQVIGPDSPSGHTYSLTASFAGSAISTSGTGTFVWQSVPMGVPVAYCTEFNPGNNAYRYFILDNAGLVWVSGVNGGPGSPGNLSTTTIFSSINPSGTSLQPFDSGSIINGSLAIMPTTNSSNVITKTWLCVFGDDNIYILRSDNNSGFPSITGSAASSWHSFNYQSSAYFHKSIFGNDQVLYWTDGPTVSILQQKTGQLFDPTSSGTYNYVAADYLMAPTDNATAISQLPNGNGLSIIVGGTQNNLYIYPDYQSSTPTGPGPTTVLWMPESFVSSFLQTNNYILIFSGYRGNIYLTNGSSVVPLLTVPDYVAGSYSFVQDPYFMWGGSAYIDGRVFFSIQDYNASHTGANCGGIWSFVPSFSYFPNQDSGLSLRMEAASSLGFNSNGTVNFGYNGYAPVIFSGSELLSQAANGPQYIAAWTQTNNSGTSNSIDFSGQAPVTNGSPLIETDAIPVGTFLVRKTFRQIEVKFAAALVSGETVAINYRTSLEGTWVTAGAVIYDSDMLAAIVNGVDFEKAQIIQLQVLLNGTATNPSWIRVKEIYLR